jgi:DNA-binding NtrC family response regulator/tetratricopeptide (TPR) repeat protein
VLSIDAALSALRRGRFLEAFQALQGREPDDTDSLGVMFRSAILADVLQRLGKVTQAEEIAERVLASKKSSPGVSGRCLFVLGNVSRERGHADDAAQRFQHAISFAEAAGDSEGACWAELRLLATIGDRGAMSVATARLPEVRHRVNRSGDPSLLAALHLWVAEVETKRGLADVARAHIRQGRAILAGHENVWLEGSAAIDDACICFLDSDIDGALRFASDALRISELSGDRATRVAALVDLAHACLALGDLEKGRSYLERAMASCEPGGSAQLAILDGLAQHQLAIGHYEECERLLDHTQAIAEQFPMRPGYYESWSYRTRMQLLVRRHRLTEAQEFFTAITSAGLGDSHPALWALLETLCAETHVRSRDLGAAALQLDPVLRDYMGSSVDVFSEAQRVIGEALVISGLPDLGVRHLERAAGVLGATQNLSARSESLHTLVMSVSRSLANDPGPVWQPEVSRRPCDAVTYRADTTSTAVETREGSGQSIENVVALFEIAGQPVTFGLETLRLVVDSHCTSHTVLCRRHHGHQSDGKATVLAWAGCGFGRAEEIAQCKGPGDLLALDSAEAPLLLLISAPRPDFGSQTRYWALRRMATVALHLERVRAASMALTALWPVEDSWQHGSAAFGSPRMAELVQTLRKIAPSDLPVLITGETGTGKEVLARLVHKSSGRAGRQFVPFNCAAVPRDLVESQMFGHRRGAFSGAIDAAQGIIRAAAGGTLFLDEVGDLAPETQPKLLRFLESGEIQPLGEASPVKVDVRVIAASNADLERLVAQGRFRDDLFYRLNVIRFKVPPLRERREEIPALVQHFLSECSESLGKGGIRIADETMEHMLLYSWPGNVRQLANEVRRLVALAEPDSVVMPGHLTEAIMGDRCINSGSSGLNEARGTIVRLNQPLASAIEQVERAVIKSALQTSSGRLDVAAKALGVSRKGLYLKRLRLGLA